MPTASVPLRDDLFATPDGEAPYLIGGRCVTCGAVRFPWRKHCIACFERDCVERIPLSRLGILYTFTIARVPSAGFVAPYAFGYVDLPEGVRIFALLGGEQERLHIGQAVQLELTPCKRDHAGRTVIGYRFVPQDR